MIETFLTLVLGALSIGSCSPDVRTGELGDMKVDKIGFVCTWRF